MADIDFPTYLNKPQQGSFSRETAEGFSLSQPASGPAYYRVDTDDLPNVYNVTFRFSRDESLAFESWLDLYRDVRFGALFNMSVYAPGEDLIQECRFTQGGTPQLTSVQSLDNVYNAQIEVRKLVKDWTGSEELILGVMEDGGLSTLQYAVNIDMPEV